jgi:hypothetical protein
MKITVAAPDLFRQRENCGNAGSAILFFCKEPDIQLALPASWSEQPRLLRFEFRQDMTVIIEPLCHRIAAEHHEFPGVIGIG